jgi:hypothetical protein
MDAVSAGVEKARVFDPALKHYAYAFRRGEPVFADPEIGRRWRRARRRALDHLLRIVSESPWCQHLILRGSVVLQAWLGAAAREPGDLDWIVWPHTIGLKHRLMKQILHGLIDDIRNSPLIGDVRLIGDKITSDAIWTYDRAPGKRIVVPWHRDGLPPGSVQLDFVFGENFPGDAVQTAVPTADGDSILVWTASREQSLAWKLMWLATDIHPQGKDLYDAVLLAEQTRLPRELFDKTVAPLDQHLLTRFECFLSSEMGDRLGQL